MNFSGNKAVPQFNTYFPSKEEMGSDQLCFFSDFSNRLRSGSCVDIEGNISYLFLFLYETISSQYIESIQYYLKLALECYGSNKSVTGLIPIWLADTYALQGKYSDALHVSPKLTPNAKSNFQTQRLLSLKYQCGEPLRGGDLVTLFGPQVTKYAKDHLEEIASYVEVQIREYENHYGVELIEQWAQRAEKRAFHAFVSTPEVREIRDLPLIAFGEDSEVEEFGLNAIREAENTFREERGIPRIGEGWVSETRLYYEIKDALEGYTVKQHARPDWLAPQHLDVLIEELGVAVEFQGIQHDRPVDFFGGEKAFKKVQERDQRKARLCEENGVPVVYVREGYDLSELLGEIWERSENQNT